MSTFNKLILGLVALFAFACGSVDDQAQDDQSGDEIGQSEEAISTGTGYGFTNATTQLRCQFPGPLGQVCRANKVAAKSATYCFQGFTQADRDLIAGGIEVVDSATNWTINPSVGGAFPCDIAIQNGGTNQSTGTCSGSMCIESLVKFIPGGTLGTLTSPAGTGHVNGSRTSFTAASVVVDANLIPLVETGPGFHSALMTQIGGHIAAKFIGLGGQTANLSSVTRRQTYTNGFTGGLNGLSSGEVCKANNTTAGNLNQIVEPVTCGSD